MSKIKLVRHEIVNIVSLSYNITKLYPFAGFDLIEKK